MTLTAKTITTHVAPALAELGFTKRASGIFTRSLDNDVLGWIGLNTASKKSPPDTIGVNPVAGLRHQGIEELVAELCGEKPHRYQPPTVSSPLGYLLPQKHYEEWTITTADLDAQLGDLVDKIRTGAAPFIEKHADLPHIVDLIKQQFGPAHQLAYRLPAALLLSNDLGQARARVEHELDGLDERTDAAAQRYRQFAEALLTRV